MRGRREARVGAVWGQKAQLHIFLVPFKNSGSALNSPTVWHVLGPLGCSPTPFSALRQALLISTCVNMFFLIAPSGAVSQWQGGDT